MCGVGLPYNFPSYILHFIYSFSTHHITFPYSTLYHLVLFITHYFFLHYFIYSNHHSISIPIIYFIVSIGFSKVYGLLYDFLYGYLYGLLATVCSILRFTALQFSLRLSLRLSTVLRFSETTLFLRLRFQILLCNKSLQYLKKVHLQIITHQLFPPCALLWLVLKLLSCD